MSHWVYVEGAAYAYLERDLVRGWFGLLDRLNGATEELLRMCLAVQHLVGGDCAQYALQACRVRAMQEELLPEALGELDIFLVLLRVVSYNCSTCIARRGRTLNRVS